MPSPNPICRLALVALTLALAGCGRGDDNANLAALDAQLTNNTADPALRSAVNGKLAVDPDLVSQSNRNSVRPADKPYSGAVPAGLKAPADKDAAKRLAGGTLMQAPAPDSGAVASGVTLGQLAQSQKYRPRKARACGAPRVAYGPNWASRLPATFPLYPGAALVEAAGSDNGACQLRAVTFTTGAPVQDVIDFYFTMARRAGYSGERQTDGTTEILGGTRDDGAYYLTFRAIRGGGTSVDMIVNEGS